MKLSEGIGHYVLFKRAAGLKYQTEESTLLGFLVLLGDVQLSEVMTQDVLTFLNSQPSVTFSWRRKYRLLMYFFEYWAVREAMPTLLMPNPRPKVRQTFVPHIYSREHIHSLLKATFKSQKRYSCLISPQTFRTLILLLYGTGATVGEALGLGLTDMDLKTGMLTIHNNRSDRSRRIPICSDLQNAIRGYVAWRSSLQIHCDRLFVKNDGYALITTSLIINFRKLRKIACITRHDGSKSQPTMQDLRPTFAVHRITSWIRNGADLNRMLPALAVYMGHAGLASTQKYLLMTPERFRRELNKLSPMPGKERWREDKVLMTFLASL
ncbi:tyrosine-type recombinase/integrase [Tunturiibacter gelidoferens]|uniref:Tyrosine-type recombinase/integrase n=1 Tax=Tunturiibacter gelidiferens TaxID=3069689 RepID=A0AAU7YZP2_9BACT